MAAPTRRLGTFTNDPRLSQADIDTITAWVDAGAPKGDDKDLPAVPKFADGWTIGKPDAIFTMDEEFQIPASGAIDYQYFRVPTHLTEDRWIQAIEIKPGARSHVHHVIAFTQKSGEPLNPNGVLGPGYIGGVTPNKPGITFEPGVARLLRGNTDIVMQVHYTTNGYGRERPKHDRRRDLRQAAADAGRRRRPSSSNAALRDPGLRRQRTRSRA